MPRFVVALLCLALSLTSALAQRPDPGEVIDQVAKYTGLTNDTVSLALKDNAAALGRLTDAVQALQIAQQVLDAKNADIAATVFWSATDTAAEALLPPPLMTAIKAMRAYKSIWKSCGTPSSFRSWKTGFTTRTASSARRESPTQILSSY